MSIISGGFSGPRSATDAKSSPGQYLTTDFPVLSADPTPHIPVDPIEFRIDDDSDPLQRLEWKASIELPYSASVLRSAKIVSRETPSQIVPILDHWATPSFLPNTAARHAFSRTFIYEKAATGSGESP